MRQQLVLEQPEYFSNFDIPVDVDWLESHNIDKMFACLFEVQIRRPITGAEGALRIFEDSQMNKLVSCMSLANIEETDIELLIQSKIDINYTLEDIREFINYFFNVDGWTKKDKELFISTVKKTDIKRAYLDAISGDKNKLLWKLKLSPSLDFDELLREMTYDCFYKFKELVQVDPDTALKFAATVDKLSGRLEKIIDDRKADTGAKDGFSILFEEDDREGIKSLADLKGEGEGT
jgi:hypothetical protein